MKEQFSSYAGLLVLLGVVLLVLGCGRVFVSSPSESEEAAKDPLALENEEDFAKQIAEGVVLVDFHATWCPPCKRLSPILSQYAQEMSGRVAVLKVDVDKFPALANQYEVKAIPHLVLFQGGKPIGVKAGFMNQSNLVSWVSGLTK